MIQIPANLISAYTSFIEQSGVKAGQHRYYVKWLRYYLDFCHKHNFEQTAQESLSAFTGKLKEKKQAENLRKQAHHAISIFYEMEHCSGRKVPNVASRGNVTAVGRTSLEVPSSHTKQRSFNQVDCSDVKTTSRTIKEAKSPLDF